MANNNLLFFVIAALAVVVFFGFAVYFTQAKPSPNGAATVPPGDTSNAQEIFIRATSAGTYDKPYVIVKKGIPVKLNFSADQDSGCGRMLLMRDFGVQLLSKNGETQSAFFTPQKEGRYEFSCSMRMFRGTLEVVP